MRQSKFHRDIPNDTPMTFQYHKDHYSIKVVRPEGLNDSQWKKFCDMMDQEDFENKCLWDAVDGFTEEVQENEQ
tara:strand:+ start:2199 stop:2420 length:222 start_codon:yes stop_codon:yes gene_type:complete